MTFRLDMCVEMSYDQPKTILKRFTVSCLAFENIQIQYDRQHPMGDPSYMTRVGSFGQHTAGTKSGPMKFSVQNRSCSGCHKHDVRMQLFSLGLRYKNENWSA